MNLEIGRKRLGRDRFVCYHKLVDNKVPEDPVAKVWGPYPNYDDIGRFEYGRRMWRLPEMRSRLRQHWTDSRHPYRDRFLERHQLIEEVLASEDSPEQLDVRLRARGSSLRCVAREIPPVFGSFF